MRMPRAAYARASMKRMVDGAWRGRRRRRGWSVRLQHGGRSALGMGMARSEEKESSTEDAAPCWWVLWM